MLNEKGEPGGGGDAKEGTNNGEPLVAPGIKVKAVPKVRAKRVPIFLCVVPLGRSHVVG
jgi:hypothetical protein